MNDDVIEILRHRATIIENISGLHSYGNKAGSDKQQLSLFGDAVESKISLIEPKDINYDKLLEDEKDVLGVYLTYNPFDSYILVEKKFCTHNIESLMDLNADAKKGIILLARVNEIKYKKSEAGNSYAKLIINDATSGCMVYLWGKKYGELIGNIFNNQIYLIELGYKNDGNTLFVVNMRTASSVPIEKIVKNISLYIADIEDIPKVREYVYGNMIGSKYSLSFIFNGEIYNAPYKVDFDSNDYYYLKNFIYDIKL
jgi:DNA polymerase III alpha subunit